MSISLQDNQYRMTRRNWKILKRKSINRQQRFRSLQQKTKRFFIINEKIRQQNNSLWNKNTMFLLVSILTDFRVKIVYTQQIAFFASQVKSVLQNPTGRLYNRSIKSLMSTQSFGINKIQLVAVITVEGKFTNCAFTLRLVKQG